MTKNAVYLTVVLLFAVFNFSGCTSNPPIQTAKPRLVYTYARLQLLELDQMNELIQGKVDKFLETRNKELLMDAVRICLSRPNGDSLVEKTFDSIRYRANSTDSWESAVEGLTQWAISELKSEAAAPIDQVTYLIMLENLIVEFNQGQQRQTNALVAVKNPNVFQIERKDNELIFSAWCCYCP